VSQTLQQALRHATRLGLERLDAQMLLLHTVGRPLHERAWLLAHDTDPITPAAWSAFDALCQRRQAGEPVAYLTGQRHFHGLALQVDARVLDPRPDTETLVDWALEQLARLPGTQRPSVLDLGTGSGAIALALQRACPQAEVWAVDASLAALSVARLNAERLGLPVQFRHQHWLRAGSAWAHRPSEARPPPARFDLIVSNPPYLRADDPHLPALRHEPRSALVGGPDGLDDLREIITSAPHRLKPTGWLLLEHGWDQGDAVAALLRAQGMQAISQREDLAGHVRCSGGQRGTTPAD
jgi:release factor glutamine methyltransferase